MNYICFPAENIRAIDEFTDEELFEMDVSRTCPRCGEPKAEKTDRPLMLTPQKFVLGMLHDKRFGQDDDAIDAREEIKGKLKKLDSDPRGPEGVRILALESASYKILAEVVKKPSQGYQPSMAGQQRAYIKAIAKGKDCEKDPREAPPVLADAPKAS